MSPRRKLAQPRVVGDVAYIPLSRGFEAIIDLADLEDVGRYSWHARFSRNGLVYAGRSRWADVEPGIPILLHRFLMRPPLGMVIDHINGDGLDNRRRNLRVCEQAVNCLNKVAERHNLLGRGVQAVAAGKFAAQLTHRGRNLHLGRYLTKEEAAAAVQGAKVALGKADPMVWVKG